MSKRLYCVRVSTNIFITNGYLRSLQNGFVSGRKHGLCPHGLYSSSYYHVYY